MKSPQKSRLGAAANGLSPGRGADASVELQRARSHQENQLNTRKGLAHSPSDQTMERTMSWGSEDPITGVMQAEIEQPLIRTSQCVGTVSNGLIRWGRYSLTCPFTHLFIHSVSYLPIYSLTLCFPTLCGGQPHDFGHTHMESVLIYICVYIYNLVTLVFLHNFIEV